MSDDPEGTGHLATEQIDRQLREMREALTAFLKVGAIRMDGGKENSRSARRIIEGVIIVALVGLGAEVWLLKGTVEVQQASVQFLQKQVDSVTDETRANSHSVDEMKGRFYRGLQDGKDPYAPH